MNSHLDSEQLESALAGQPSAEVAQHLGRCARCTEELAATRTLFSGLRLSADATARRAFAQASQPAPQASAFWMSGFSRGLVAAVLTAAVLVPVALHRHTATGVVVANNGSPQAAEMLSDDALLSSVQNDLSSSVPQPLLPLAGTTTNTTEQTTTMQRKTR